MHDPMDLGFGWKPLPRPGCRLPPPEYLPPNFDHVAVAMLGRPPREREEPRIFADVLLGCLYGPAEKWPPSFEMLDDLDLVELICNHSHKLNLSQGWTGRAGEAMIARMGDRGNPPGGPMS